MVSVQYFGKVSVLKPLDPAPKADNCSKVLKSNFKDTLCLQFPYRTYKGRHLTGRFTYTPKGPFKEYVIHLGGRGMDKKMMTKSDSGRVSRRVMSLL